MEPLNVTLMVVLGSESDFAKLGGQEKVKEKLERLKPIITDFSASVSVISCHRNPRKLLDFCQNNQAIVWIAVAGKAAALPGMIDAYLRDLGKPAQVMGVSISSDNEDDHRAASLSITQLPERPVKWMGYDEQGFDDALAIVRQSTVMQIGEVKTKEPQINIIHVK